MPVVVIRGIGDVGSAVAHSLFLAGHRVVIHDGPRPTATRRLMAFADAVFDGRAALAGVAAERFDDLDGVMEALEGRQVVPVVVGELSSVLERVRPDVLVDARMRKRSRPEVQRGLAPLTIGIGPNFVAGETIDLAVESAYGEDLGKVVRHGGTGPLAGEPRPLAGHARDRYVYAPVEGTFATQRSIGDRVREGETVARIGSVELRAPLTGVLRGLTRDGVPVAAGTKVIEVDPREDPAGACGIGERPARIAAGVQAAVQEWLRNRKDEDGVL